MKDPTPRLHILGSVGACALLLVAGCENGNDTTTDPAMQPVTITIPPFEVPAGNEVQDCYYMKAPIDHDIDIGKVDVNFSKGTHHAHIYIGDTPHDDGKESCFMAVDFEKWHLLFASGREQVNWELPEGVAFRMKAHQQLLIQVHFTNADLLTTANDIGQGTFTLEPRRPDQVQMYMGSVFGQQRNIHMGPLADFSVEGMCKLPRPVTLGAFAGHYHFRGKAFTAFRTDSVGEEPSQFYQTTNFAEPLFQIFDQSQPMTFDDNQRIVWRCDYQNNLDQDVSLGPREVDQEDCNMFLYYYPAGDVQEFTPCVSYDRCPQPCTEGQVCTEAGTCVAQ